MTVEQVANDVVYLFRKQEHYFGSVSLLSIKVSLPEGLDADEVSSYIEAHYPSYKAHSKLGGKNILAIGHR